MISKKRWVVIGVAGAVGLTLVGGAAAATAATMNLQTTDGRVVGDSVIGNTGTQIGPDGVKIRATDTSASVISSPSPVVPSVVSVVSVVSAPSPVPAPPAPAPAPPAPAPPAPAPVDSPASAPSAASVASAPSS